MPIPHVAESNLDRQARVALVLEHLYGLLQAMSNNNSASPERRRIAVPTCMKSSVEARRTSWSNSVVPTVTNTLMGLLPHKHT